MGMQNVRSGWLHAATIICIVGAANSGFQLLFAQQDPATSHRSIGGTVLSVTPERLYVKDHGSSVVVLLGNGAQVTKKAIRHDFSDVHVGDKILMRGQRSPSGDFIASEVWVNFNAFYGRILSVNGDSYEVQIFTEGGEVTDKTRKVVIDSDTMGEGNQLLPRSELVPGRYVQTFGIKTSDGTVLATRVLFLRPFAKIPPETTVTDSNGRMIPKKSN